MPAAPPYRRAPARRPMFELRDVTAPLGVGRAAALIFLTAGTLASLVPQAAEIECILAGVECKLVTYRGLYTAERFFHGARLTAVTAAGDPDLPLARSVEALERAGDGQLPLPTRGIYYDPTDVWRDDDRLVDTARGFFFGGTGGYFTVRQRYTDGLASAGLPVSLVGSLVGLACLLWAERKTRRLTLTIDLDARTARARSVGLGGPTLTHERPFGADPRLQRVDHPGEPDLPQVCVACADSASLPLLTGHAPAHRADLDRLVARANRALDDPAPPRSPSLFMRLAPSVVLALASVALPVRFATQRGSLPPITGTIEVTSSVERCVLGGITLGRGARLAWSHPIGTATVLFTANDPNPPPRTVPVTLAVRPGQTTRVDCASVPDLDPATRFISNGPQPGGRIRPR